ncbi:MAG: hypothetical protein ACJAYN_003209 [Bermanella sp.]|jgi:hypothetical protein
MSWHNLLVVTKSMIFIGHKRDNIKIKLKILIQSKKGDYILLCGFKREQNDDMQ